MIRRTKHGWQLVSKKGKPLSEKNLTKKQVLKRLRQVEWFKRHK